MIALTTNVIALINAHAGAPCPARLYACIRWLATLDMVPGLQFELAIDDNTEHMVRSRRSNVSPTARLITHPSAR